MFVVLAVNNEIAIEWIADGRVRESSGKQH